MTDSKHSLAYLRRNPTLTVGLVLLSGLVLGTLGGSILIDTSAAYPMSARPARPPSADLPFGSDTAGRDLLAVMILGTGQTMKIGLIGGGVGVLIGALLGLVAGYFRGWVDAVISTAVDVALTIPPLLVLIAVAASLKGGMTVNSMAFIIALMTWREPARQIRAQVLTLREKPYVLTARLSGQSELEIVFREILPNLIPYLAANFVIATGTAILSAVGLEAIGLGANNAVTLGSAIYWMMTESAFLRGMWWWVLEPISVLILLFIAIYMISLGMDEWANPRLRKRGTSR